MNMDQRIKRINELYHKSQSEGLTSDEIDEQKKLRREYIESVRGSLKNQLDNIDIKESDGSITNLGEQARKRALSEKGQVLSEAEAEENKISGVTENKALSKAELRRQMLKKRQDIPDEIVLKLSERICENVSRLSEYQSSDTILLYSAYNHEVDTRWLFEKAIESGKRVAYPKSQLVDGKPFMQFYYIYDLSELAPGYKGIMEPDIYNHDLDRYKGEKALCIVPGLAFDEDCNRIGYGKGFYDCFINENKEVTTVGIAYSCQLVERLNKEPSDATLDYLITEDPDEYYTK